MTFVSKHHYALELARQGHEVVFFGPPQPSQRLTLTAVHLQERIKGQLLLLQDDVVATGLRFMPPSLRRWLEARWLARLESRLGGPIDVIWNFENSRFYDMAFAGNRLRIYQQVDLNQAFHAAHAAATADLSIALSDPIARVLQPYARQLLRLTHGHHGVSSTSPLPCEWLQIFEATRQSHGAQLMLVGNLDIPYLDIPLLVQAVAQHPQAMFHLVGPYRAGIGLHGALQHAPNVRFWGPQPSQHLPLLMAQADLLLVTYQQETHREQLANPHKLMEYLASGRAILATHTLEYAQRADLMTMSSTAAEFQELLAAVLPELPALNAPERVAHRQAYAREHTYSQQLQRIAQALGPRAAMIA